MTPPVPLFQPINADHPTPQQLACSAALEDMLRNVFHLYESEEEMQKREEVLANLSATVKSWIQSIAADGQPITSDGGGRIFTFGSYRLGVHGPNADIDTLCVAPNFVKREDFFNSLYEILLQNPKVTELHVSLCCLSFVVLA